MTRNVHIEVTSIDWDTEDDEFDNNEADLDLPGIVFMTINDVDEEDDLEDIIADKLSDDYGFCVNSFEWKEIM
jgi:hypothetical protein